MNPNIIVFGVGHSGTTIVTRMLQAAGWNLPCDHETETAESLWFRDANNRGIREGHLPSGAAEFLAGLPQPWCLKDPRMVVTLPLWESLLLRFHPVLLWVTRTFSDVVASYERRNELRDGMCVAQLHSPTDLWRHARDHYEWWPGPKVRIAYEHIADAVKLFKVSATDPQSAAESTATC